MFFAPPKVKSLSRYAEYGAYLGNRHFLIMLVIAMMIHMMVLGVYSLLPSEEVIKIPVRVLNIKLASGGAGGGSLRASSASSASLPVAKAPSSAETDAQDADEELEQMQEESADVAMGSRELPKAPVKPAPVAHAPARPTAAKHEKATHAAKANHKVAAPSVPTSDLTMETPKKFVRAGDAAAGNAVKGHGKSTGGNDSEVMGDVGGTEIITRYTQTISQWIQNHQIFAKAACGEAAAHGVLCNAKGKVTVRLRIDRGGNIITNTVDMSSGKELIDQAAIAMVRASDPVPSVPNNFPETQLEFLIPVQVDLSKQ